MKKPYTLLLIFSICILLQSCTSLALLYFQDKAIVRSARCYSDSLDKSVILFPMLHLGTDKHFSEVRNVLDSLKASGYVVYYEGVGAYIPETETDSLIYDTLKRKERLITHIYVSDYSDKDNKTIKPAIRNSGLVMQSKDSLGLNTPNDIWADMMQDDLIEKFEQKYGEIILTQYDFDTPLKSAYIPHTAITYDQRQYYLRDMRDEQLLNKILTSSDKKIAVVFGGSHTALIRNYLVYDYNFSLDKKYKGQQILNEINKRERQAARESKKMNKK